MIKIRFSFEEITVQSMIAYKNFKLKNVLKNKIAKSKNLKAISRRITTAKFHQARSVISFCAIEHFEKDNECQIPSSQVNSMISLCAIEQLVENPVVTRKDKKETMKTTMVCINVMNN